MKPRRLVSAVLLLLAELTCIKSPFVARADEADALAGRSLFRRLWVPAPTRTDAADGLGPLFNARSCAGCHENAGPSRVRRGERQAASTISGAVFLVAGPQGIPHPWYGRQLQTGSVPGLAAEARAGLVLEPSGRLRTELALLGPPLGDGFNAAPRIAPSLKGVAMLERIDETAVLARARPEEQRRLGLSGLARLIAGADGKTRLGRYGWKASQPDLASQTAEAFATDLGLSSPLRPQPYGDCTPLQLDCLPMPNGESPAFDGREISRRMLEMVVAYLASLAAPERAGDARGAELFAATGCAACHVPALPSPDGGMVPAFTDLLLHDMGPGLDDHVPEPGVASSLWRTAPLFDLVSAKGARRYLHDGRAASVAEAVRWHGGEAAAARNRFLGLSDENRTRLVTYVEGR